MNGVVEGVEKPRCVRRLPRLNWGKGRLEEGVSRRNVAPKTIEELWQCQLTLPFWPISPPPPHTQPSQGVTWAEVKTRKVLMEASGAKPRHCRSEAMTEATKVPWPIVSWSLSSSVQLVRSSMFRKKGWFSSIPAVNNKPDSIHVGSARYR